MASGRGAGFFGLRQRGGGVFFRRRKVQISAPHAVNSEPSLMYRSTDRRFNDGGGGDACQPTTGMKVGVGLKDLNV